MLRYLLNVIEMRHKVFAGKSIIRLILGLILYTVASISNAAAVVMSLGGFGGGVQSPFARIPIIGGVEVRLVSTKFSASWPSMPSFSDNTAVFEGVKLFGENSNYHTIIFPISSENFNSFENAATGPDAWIGFEYRRLLLDGTPEVSWWGGTHFNVAALGYDIKDWDIAAIELQVAANIINSAIKQGAYSSLNRHRQHANSQNIRRLAWLTTPKLS